jgi:hypothetical protein
LNCAVVAIEDAGGARALAPVVRAMLMHGERPSLILGRVAADTLRASGVPLGPADEVASDADVTSSIERLVPNARILVTSSTAWGLRVEARAVAHAKCCGCPTVTLVDFWSNYEHRLSYPSQSGWSVLPDRLAVIDDIMRDQLLRGGVSAKCLVVTGSPAFDNLLSESAPPLPAIKNERVVAFLSQPITALYGVEGDPTYLGYTEHSILRSVATVVSRSGLQLLVRAHPREDAVALKQFVRTLPGARIDTRPLRAIVEGSIAVVGMTTMALVEAALMGRLSLSVQIGRRGDDALPTNACGLTLPIADENELCATLVRATNGDPSLEPQRRLAALGWRPGATERMLDVIRASAR